MDVMALVFEYRLLLSMQQEFDIPLDERQRARLDALWSLLEGKHNGPDAHRVMGRFPYPTSVRFSSQTSIGSGDVVNLSGGGVAIRTSHRIAQGAQVILRFDGASPGTEYVFPCRVVWAADGLLGTMGLAFDGAPSKLRASNPTFFRRAA